MGLIVEHGGKIGSKGKQKHFGQGEESNMSQKLLAHGNKFGI